MKLIKSICALLVASFCATIQANDTVGSVLITQNEVSGNCETQYDAMTLSDREKQFRQAVCRFHQKSFATADELNRNLTQWQNLQVQGLSNAQQALASLLEGLTHCHQAKQAMPNLPTGSALDSTYFCASRANAMASFNSIHWKVARFGYGSDTQFDETALLDELGACFSQNNGPLNSNHDVTCGITPNLTQAEKEQAISDQYNAVESRYFGGTSPITAMFVEKKEIAEKTLENTESRVSSLNQQAADVASAHSQLQNLLHQHIKNPDDPNSPLDTTINQYKYAYAMGNAILETFQQWEEGLLVQKHDDGTETQHKTILESKTDDLQTRKQGIIGSSGWVNKVDFIAQKIADIENQQSGAADSAKKLCQIYYCHLAIAPGMWDPTDYYLTACQTPNLFQVEKNPLCEIVGTKLVVGDLQWTPNEFCADYGFNVAQYGRVGLLESETAGCFD